MLDFAIMFDVIKRSGSWFSYDGNKIGQGRDSVKEVLRSDAALREEIELRVRDAMNEAKER